MPKFERYFICDICGGWVDVMNVDEVYAHQGPASPDPHPPSSRPQDIEDKEQS